MKLGRLKKVDLREVWKTEAQHFTPWLANEENLALLGDTIGLDLECEAVEKNVGPFRADILCKDTANDSWVLIENQVERTDHTHLGQLLTYAAGLKTVTIVWIAQRFTDEHRAALVAFGKNFRSALARKVDEPDGQRNAYECRAEHRRNCDLDGARPCRFDGGMIGNHRHRSLDDLARWKRQVYRLHRVQRHPSPDRR